MSSSEIRETAATAQNVVVTDDALIVELADGRTISVPLAWFPRLFAGSPEERANFRFIGGGRGIHWLPLDEDISVENLLAGRPSDESQESLRAWLAARDAKART
jgi:hypothetical protein